MNLKNCCWQILLVVCYIKAENIHNQINLDKQKIHIKNDVKSVIYFTNYGSRLSIRSKYKDIRSKAESGKSIKICKVEAKNRSQSLKPWDGDYDNFILQNSDQTIIGVSESLELNTNREQRIAVKKIKKNKKKSGKRSEKSKQFFGRKKKNPKHKSKTKRRWWKKNVKKFVKTVSDRNRDSHMSGSKELAVQDKPVDIIVHIKMKE